MQEVNNNLSSRSNQNISPVVKPKIEPPILDNQTPKYRFKYSRKIYCLGDFSQVNITVNIFDDEYYTKTEYKGKEIYMYSDGTVCLKNNRQMKCVKGMVRPAGYNIIKNRFVQDRMMDGCINLNRTNGYFTLCYRNKYLVNMTIDNLNGCYEVWESQPI